MCLKLCSRWSEASFTLCLLFLIAEPYDANKSWQTECRKLHRVWFINGWNIRKYLQVFCVKNVVELFPNLSGRRCRVDSWQVCGLEVVWFWRSTLDPFKLIRRCICYYYFSWSSHTVHKLLALWRTFFDSRIKLTSSQAQLFLGILGAATWTEPTSVPTLPFIFP